MIPYDDCDIENVVDFAGVPVTPNRGFSVLRFYKFCLQRHFILFLIFYHPSHII